MPASFSRRVDESLKDDRLRTSLTRAASGLNRWRDEGYATTASFTTLQSAARALRARSLDHLPALLQQLEASLLARGSQVAWAVDAEEACRMLVALAESRHVKVVARSRSYLAEEVGADAALAAAGLTCIDMELGDTILQLSGDKASHPVFPAIHWRKEDVAALFVEQLDMPETVDIQSMASAARFKLRRQIVQADMSISGVDLAVAENGVLALAGDSGADRLGLALARVHVALLGIDQVVATLQELLLLLQLKARSASGAALAGSVTLLDGPAEAGDPDGPSELILLIVDNGRSDLLRWGYGEALACIRCGACHNVCPVYREIGGPAYGGQPAGPIGAVVQPLLPAPPAPAAPTARRRISLAKGKPPAASGASAQPHLKLRSTALADLPWASTLCGACSAACPVGIDIPRLLVRLRGDLVLAGRTPTRDRVRRQVFARSMDSAEHFARLHRWLVRRSRLAATSRFTPAKRTFRARWQAKGGNQR